MVLLAVMTVTIVWCLVQQVMYRFGHAWSPVNAYAVSLFILATGAFAVILLHPTSTVPAREGLTMTIDAWGRLVEESEIASLIAAAESGELVEREGEYVAGRRRIAFAPMTGFGLETRTQNARDGGEH